MKKSNSVNACCPVWLWLLCFWQSWNVLPKPSLLTFNPLQSGIKSGHPSEFILLKVFNDLHVLNQVSLVWSGFIWSVTSIGHPGSGTEDALAAPSTLTAISIWCPGQDIKLLCCAFLNMHFRWLTQGGVGSWVLHLLSYCLPLSF